MARPWEAEHRVDEALAARLIEAQFPELRPARLELLGEGWDNVAWLLRGEIVFRFPRRQIAVELLETERRLLPALALRLPLPIPQPDHVGQPGDGYPWPFLGYRRLPGETACRACLDDRERAAIAAPLARFLAALHAFPVDEARRLGAPPDRIGRLDLSAKIPELLERMERMRALGYLRDIGPFREILDAGSGLRPSEEVRLVHGDLYVRHLLIGPGRGLAGVIDWGDLHIGDPAVDLILPHAFLPAGAREAFREACGDIPEERWQLGRIRAIYSSAAIVVYGHDTGDADLVREGMRVFLGL